MLIKPKTGWYTRRRGHPILMTCFVISELLTRRSYRCRILCVLSAFVLFFHHKDTKVTKKNHKEYRFWLNWHYRLIKNE